MLFVDDNMKSIYRSKYRPEIENSITEAILLLKNSGYSQMQCLRVLMEELNLTIADADQIILNSEIWTKEKEKNLKFRKDFEKGLDDL